MINNIKELNKKVNNLNALINPKESEKRINELEKELNKANWNNIEMIAEYRDLKNKMSRWSDIVNGVRAMEELAVLAQEVFDTGLMADIELEYGRLLSDFMEFELETMFVDKYDKENVILTIHAGAGGKEAQDWAGMLLRMYCRWADKKGFKTNILDYQDGEDPSVCKSATIEVIGKNAYGLLKNETGVHRLVRVSPFDSQSRRHTSFAAVDVMPEITPDMNIVIDPKDLQVDTYRASGAGGQHVNKTESAIRITHIPSGIVVSCQNERSQYQNRDSAMKMLLSKLMKIKEQEHLDEISQIQGVQQQIQWGSQIRSYVFMPYQMVKDHRTNCETGNIEAVMNGNIDDFIYSSLVECM